MRDEFIYTSLCVFFSVIIVVDNLIYQKFVFLSLFSLYTFELSVGAILYPLTFLLLGLITEFYGKDKAKLCIGFGICMNIFIACILVGMDYLDATAWSRIDNATFHKVFGLYNIAFIGSIIACYTAQVIDITLYLWIHRITKGKWLWVRNNGSTAISLFVDTLIIVTFMTMFSVIPTDRMWPLIINSYSFKIFFSICSIPLFYIFVRIIKKLQQSEEKKLAQINCAHMANYEKLSYVFD